MKRKYISYTVVFCVGVLCSYGSYAKDKIAVYEKKRKAAIEAITAFADRICTVIGSDEVVEQVGNLEGKLEDINIEITNKYRRSSYEGVLRDRITGMGNDKPGCMRTIINEWKSDFLPSPPPREYNVVVKPSGPFIDDFQYGPIDWGLSKLQIYIDDELVVDNYLDEHFGGSISIPEGNYIYRFEADITAPSPDISSFQDECEGSIDIYDNVMLRPKVKFIRYGIDGAMVYCELSD